MVWTGIEPVSLAYEMRVITIKPHTQLPEKNTVAVKLIIKGQHVFEGPRLSAMLTQTNVLSAYSCRLLNYFIQN